MSISFNPSLTEVYEYPAFDVAAAAAAATAASNSNTDSEPKASSGLKSNSAVGSNLGECGPIKVAQCPITHAELICLAMVCLGGSWAANLSQCLRNEN